MQSAPATPAKSARPTTRARTGCEGKRQVLAEYSITWTDRASYEDDDLVPVCLGGANADIRNHWPQPVDQAEIKDEIEAEMCRKVCAGEIGIIQAQRYFRDLDWAASRGTSP